MKERIIAAISEQNGSINFRKLAKKLAIDTQELSRLLAELKLDGQILQRDDHYELFPDDVKIGTIMLSGFGNKYVLFEGKKISLSSDFLSVCLLHDTVAFKVNKRGDAEIISIIDRCLGKMPCEVILENGRKLIKNASGDDITLDSDITNTLFPGDIILVNALPGDSADDTRYTFIKKIGRQDDPGIDEVATALSYGFDNEYSDEYMSEVYALPTEVSPLDCLDRVDYRDQKCFTIDGAYTKDMDDGVYGEMLENGNICIYVHIADVSHYIKMGSKIFERACEKTTSLYLNNSVFHMLHYIISNGICSLNPGVDRLTKTVKMEIDRNGKIVDFDIQKSVINSKKKMVYEDVDELIMRDKVVSGYEDFRKELYILYDAAIRLEKRYVLKNGKVNFANDELDIKYNADGSVSKIDFMQESVARKIIENLMIAANETVATWFSNMEIPTLYRVHEFPDLDKVNTVIHELRANGYSIKPIKDVSDSRSMQKILNTLSHYQEYPIISSMLVQTMQLARYSTENLGHYALGLEAYLHFTSPIRRLADLLVHTMSDLVLIDYEKITPSVLDDYEKILEKLGKDASRMERQAEAAEHLAERRLILKDLEKNRDMTYEAVIVETGKRVKIRVQGVDTYINCHELDHVFAFDNVRKLYYDPDTGAHIRLGTKILVKLKDVSAINDSYRVTVLGLSENNTISKKLTKKNK